jgi:hypothetical protein
VAWQLRLLGHAATVYDRAEQLGGKISAQIPAGRIPQDVLDAELARARRVLGTQPGPRPDPGGLREALAENDFVVLATGSQKPRINPCPARSCWCPPATSAHGQGRDGQGRQAAGGHRAGQRGERRGQRGGRLGATEITLIDVQQPASFGKEREEAEKYGATLTLACFTKGNHLRRRGAFHGRTDPPPTRWSSPSASCPTWASCPNPSQPSAAT